MSKKLHNPRNPDNYPWYLIIVGLPGSFYEPLQIAAPDIISPDIISLCIFASICTVASGIWALVRIHLFGAQHERIHPNKSILPILGFVAITIFAFLLNSTEQWYEHHIPHLIFALFFGVLFGFVSELIVTERNKKHRLQKQTLNKLATNQELTISEIASLTTKTELEIQRALGHDKLVPAAIAREWLENTMGIRCPPVLTA